MSRARRHRRRAHRAAARGQLAELSKLFTTSLVEWQDGPPVRVTLPSPLLVRPRRWRLIWQALWRGYP